MRRDSHTAHWLFRPQDSTCSGVVRTSGWRLEGRRFESCLVLLPHCLRACASRFCYLNPTTELFNSASRDFIDYPNATPAPYAVGQLDWAFRTCTDDPVSARTAERAAEGVAREPFLP